MTEIELLVDLHINTEHQGAESVKETKKAIDLITLDTTKKLNSMKSTKLIIVMFFILLKSDKQKYANHRINQLVKYKPSDLKYSPKIS